MDKDLIRRRVEAEMLDQGREMKELSLASGLGETYVRDFLKRGRGKLENLVPVAAQLGKPPEWILGPDYRLLKSATSPPEKRPVPNAKGYEPAPSYGPPLPVLGAGRAGDDGKLIYNGEPLEFIPRPPSLEGIENAYATYVAGRSMFPRFKEMERVWVHPRRMPKSGDDVVVQLHPDRDGEPPEGYIKEFRKYTNSSLVLFQWNPEGEFEIDRRNVKSVHVIVGSLYI